MAVERPVTFYGPWDVVIAEADAFDFLAFEVRGSDNADGIHVLKEGHPPSLEVRGAKWTLDLGAVSLQNEFEQSRYFNRKTTSGPPRGLTVTLDSHRLTGGFGPLYLGIRLDCVCLDETLNPPQIPNPYDFTYEPT